jgi:HSP20 family protein
MSLIKWSPYRNLISLPDEIDRFFNGFGLDLNVSDSVWSPTVDISETENQYEVNAEIPGLKKEDIKLSVEDNVLTLSGERKVEKETDKKNYHRIERAYGKFERSFRLPKEVDAENIKANYKNGVLTVQLPKTEAVKPKEIAVS